MLTRDLFPVANLLVYKCDSTSHDLTIFRWTRTNVHSLEMQIAADSLYVSCKEIFINIQGLI